jgi:hypothetical protein
MPRLAVSKGFVPSLVLALFAVSFPACKRGTSVPSRPPATWSFGVPRGTTREASPGAPPIQLTASDGTGLQLVSLEARVAIAGPLALTELTMGFENPEERWLEVRLEDVMRRDPKIAVPYELGSAVVYRMEQHGIMSMPVCDADRRLVGVVHLHDLMRAGAL